MQRRRTKPTIVDNSGAGQSQSNGIAERAAHAIAEQGRVMCHCMHNYLHIDIPPRHPIFAWMLKQASEFTSPFQLCSDGCPAFGRARGKPFRKHLFEFGELHCRIDKPDAIRKFETQWGEGIFLGFGWKRGESPIGTPQGVIKSTFIRRVSPDRIDVLAINRVPWHRRPLEEKRQGRQAVRLPDEARTQLDGQHGHPSGQALRMRLNRSDFKVHCYATGCAGCRAIMRKVASPSRSDSCRTRLQQLVR